MVKTKGSQRLLQKTRSSRDNWKNQHYTGLVRLVRSLMSRSLLAAAIFSGAIFASKIAESSAQPTIISRSFWPSQMECGGLRGMQRPYFPNEIFEQTNLFQQPNILVGIPTVNSTGRVDPSYYFKLSIQIIQHKIGI